MFDEPADEEPDEVAPEEELDFDVVDSESTLPPEIPQAPEPPPASEASEELQKMFWSVVVLLNLAILAASLGVMYIIFRGRLQLGGGLILVGLLGGLHAYRIYRRYEYE
ncbi:hypothetical protein ACFQDG_15720 [Natronoarchaeum mannanilyticum]|uniref:DUF7322 domain-containing protein n=1 Tax=Natronoarchaeum mannanilyticum TaxID=926360 RepID=A0AAV3T6M8_9EURY